MTQHGIYTIAGNGSPYYSGDGGAATSARIEDPEGIAVDASGNVLIADYWNSRVRVTAASTGTFYGQSMVQGDIYTIAGGGSTSGNGVAATSAGLYRPDWSRRGRIRATSSSPTKASTVSRWWRPVLAPSTASR